MDLEFLRDKFKGKESSRWITKEEVDTLVNCIKTCDPYWVIESGTANGYSSAYIATSGYIVTTFDPADRRKVWQFLPEELQQNWIQYIPEPFENSGIILEGVGAKRLEYKRGLYFFIDGDHTREGVKRDFETIKPHLRLGDVVMFHDYPSEYLMTKDINKSILPFARSHTIFDTKRGMIEMVF